MHVTGAVQEHNENRGVSVPVFHCHAHTGADREGYKDCNGSAQLEEHTHIFRGEGMLLARKRHGPIGIP